MNLQPSISAAQAATLIRVTDRPRPRVRVRPVVRPVALRRPVRAQESSVSVVWLQHHLLQVPLHSRELALARQAHEFAPVRPLAQSSWPLVASKAFGARACLG